MHPFVVLFFTGTIHANREDEETDDATKMNVRSMDGNKDSAIQQTIERNNNLD